MIKTPIRCKIDYRIIWCAIAALSLWIRCGIPMFAISNAGNDDALFIRLARTISLGHWLGHYDNVTLAKGMFYPLFIAASGFLSIPLKLAEQIVYLLVSAMAARFVRQRTGSVWLGTALFALLAFNPILWSEQLARVIRDGLYISLSFATIVLAIMIAFSSQRLGKRLWLAAGGGLMLGAFWLTREEGPWIVPALLVVVISAVGALGQHRKGDACKKEFHDLIACAFVFILCFSGLNNLVAAINHQAYGVYETVEFKSHNFVRAYSALAGIKSKSWQPKVVIPSDARQAAYAVSPSARELQPYLDGSLGEAWRINGCTQSEIPMDRCPEILAGWFMWALRDSVSMAGHAGSAQAADAFYGRLADELEAACADGRLSCTHRRPTLAPPFKRRYLHDILTPARHLLGIIFAFTPRVSDLPPNSGNQDQQDAFMDLTGFAPVATDTVHEAAGWVGSKSGVPFFVLRSPFGMTTLSPSFLPPGPLAELHPGWGMGWFDLSFICPHNCDLGVVSPDGSIIFIPADDLRNSLTVSQPDKAVRFDRVKTSDRLPVTAIRQRFQRRIAVILSRVYRIFIPILSALALLGLGTATILRRGPPIEIYTLAVSSLVAIACRIALLAYLDVTSIPSDNGLYIAPAAPFVLIFVVTGIYAGWAALRKTTSPEK